MKYKAILATLVLSAFVVMPGFVAFAAESAVIETETVTTTESAPTSEEAMAGELAQLKAKLKDPSTGTITRFILRFQIKQLENQLNIKRALQENPA